jgi:hypothetical protein
MSPYFDMIERPNRPPPIAIAEGMRSESEMIPILADFASRGFSENTHSLFELDLGFGVADIVSMVPNIHNVHRRLRDRLTTPLRSIEEIRVLHMIPSDRPTSVQRIVQYLGGSEKHLRYSVLSNLIRQGYIERVAKDSYVRLKEYYPITEEIFSIEAKLCDWRRGALQAKRYQLFSHYSFLAVSQEFLHRVDFQVIRTLNIGLLGVSRDQVQVILTPRRNSWLNTEMFCLCNESFLPVLFPSLRT